MTDFSFEDIKRNLVNGATKFFKSLFQNDCISGNCRPLKIRQLPCYKVLWIHSIGPIDPHLYGKKMFALDYIFGILYRPYFFLGKCKLRWKRGPNRAMKLVSKERCESRCLWWPGQSCCSHFQNYSRNELRQSSFQLMWKSNIWKEKFKSVLIVFNRIYTAVIAWCQVV